ncbi:RNA polymerase sigma factor [Dokdonella immobilis]|uniref:RNA polymerase sigma-70 factor, ECF subfamily n=1 Tax=Dokdonella immobilis TaxID=578942 RepID=A0A1I4YKX5_9GAMM|nr:sigma-70 family RNA polymerase sigma factor [Dokdonella immobilis]SFN38702.1 RNA polymerase sigma-70 factor, ECF subfamily [Dokdonella immobilis]
MNNGFGQALDGRLLERARRGDGAAHAAIYRTYARACYNLALRILGEPAAAEDVVQDVFLRMMDTVSGFRGDAPFGAWLKRMTANATIDVIRRNKRFDGEDASDHLEASQAQGIPADSAVDAWALLMQLGPRSRAVVLLHEMEGYTHKELSGLFGQSESYSKSVLARALKRLESIAHAAGGSGAVK